MSYELNVILWDAEQHGLPATFDEASDLSVSLEAKAAAPSAAMLDFASKLMAAETAAGRRFTVYLSVLEEVQTFGTAAVSLEIPSDDNVNQSIAAIALAAREAGLVGFIEGLALALLPDGKVLPPSRRAFWEAGLEAIPVKAKKKSSKLSPEEFAEYVSQSAHTFLCKNGFEFVDEPFLLKGYNEKFYRKTHGEITQRLKIETSEVSILSISIVFYAEPITTLVHQFNIHDMPRTFLVSGREVITDSILYEKGDKTRKATDQALSHHLELLLRWLDGIHDMESLVHLVLKNCDGDFSEMITNAGEKVRRGSQMAIKMPETIVGCRLIGDPHFEELIQKFNQLLNWPPRLKASREADWPRLVQYLRDNYPQ